MRLGCLPPLITIALLYGGGQSLYTSFKNRQPTEVTLESLAAKKPDAEWLRIKGGTLDTMHAAYSSAFGVGKAQSVYIPLMSSADSRGEPIQVLVLTKDPELVKFTNDMKELDKEGTSEAEVLKVMAANVEKLKVSRPVEGLVQFGIESSGKKEDKLRKLFPNLEEDAIILEEGKKPSATTGIVCLLGGLTLGAYLLLRSSRKPSEGTPPPSSDGGAGASPPPLPQ